MKLFIAIEKKEWLSNFVDIVNCVVMASEQNRCSNFQVTICYSIRMFIIACDYFHSLIDSSHVFHFYSPDSFVQCAMSIQYTENNIQKTAKVITWKKENETQTFLNRGLCTDALKMILFLRRVIDRNQYLYIQDLENNIMMMLGTWSEHWTPNTCVRIVNVQCIQFQLRNILFCSSQLLYYYVARAHWAHIRIISVSKM